MENIKLYTVSDKYINYLSIYAPHLFHNKKPNQIHKRVYIGVILKVHGMDYFAPLSSYKEKHKQMKETLDFIKIKRYSVINLNNMFPVQSKDYTYLDFSKEQDLKYKSLLESYKCQLKNVQF
ncbi:type III toxin-antitoxin system ToxN/AbiQ family toxin [Holdemanella biformis]